MNERTQLERAIAVLRDQRTTLGDTVVETTIATLREKLSTLEAPGSISTPQRTAQRKQITIIFANVTGFSGAGQSIPDTSKLDIMNLLWQRLDKAITDQGGTIDKHIGDAVMGLFGVPVAREDDPERAVRAALTMRAALSNFVQELALAEDMNVTDQGNGESDQLPINLQLRIGINTGPVLLGGVGTGDEYTVIGDAVNVASRLERAAPAGGILISHETSQLVKGLFETEPLGPVAIRGKSEPLQVYLVLGAKQRRTYLASRGVEGIETQMVGRDKELQQLQEGWETAVHTRRGKLVTIHGEAGVGKSRLIHEFNEWLTERTNAPIILKGQTDQRMSQQPFALIRSIIAAHFNIQDNDRPGVVERKLLQGMSSYLPDEKNGLRQRVHTIGQLIGLNVAEGLQLMIQSGETTQARDRALGYLLELFTQISNHPMGAVMLLEDLHWADDASLDFIEQMANICRHHPLLVYCLARPNLFERRPTWEQLLAENGRSAPATQSTNFPLEPLTKSESRKLVHDILRKLPEIPQDLSDLIVEKAEGNPFYVEELIKVFIEDGIILPGQEKWHIQSNHLTHIRVPATLTGVLQARLDRLSELERATLQRAAVVGRMFWDSAVIHMNSLAADPIHPGETSTALQALEKRELIFRRHTSVFTGTQTFFFKHAILREVTYEGVLLRDRPVFHRQAAEWLTEQSGERIAEYAAIIAEHFELAGEQVPSAELYEMAAIRARETSDPAAAVEYYGKALSLLSEKSHQAAWQLRLQRRLGLLLRQQARLVEAAQTFMTMRYTAELDGDLAAQAHAWNGLASIQQAQADYTAMLDSATEAEQVAWLVGAEEELARALLFKSESHLRLGDTELAAAAANRALSISEGLNDTAVATKSLGLLADIYIGAGNAKRTQTYLAELADQEESLTNESAIGANLATRGRVHMHLEAYDAAQKHLQAALNLYRVQDQHTAVAHTLDALGKLAWLRGKAETARSFFTKALSLARSSGHLYASLQYRTHLSGALILSGEPEAAQAELQEVIRLAEDVSRVVSWRGLPTAYYFLALASQKQQKLEMALAAGQHALTLAQKAGERAATAAAWRVLGIALGQTKTTKITINDRQCDAAACFDASLNHTQRENGATFGLKRERAQTLAAWAEYAQSRGRRREADRMRRESEAIAQELSISLL